MSSRLVFIYEDCVIKADSRYFNWIRHHGEKSTQNLVEREVYRNVRRHYPHIKLPDLYETHDFIIEGDGKYYLNVYEKCNPLTYHWRAIKQLGRSYYNQIERELEYCGGYYVEIDSGDHWGYTKDGRLVILDFA